MLIKTHKNDVRHQAYMPIIDDGEPIIFQWHFPRGTFESRMSAFEIATFILPHMPFILPLLSGHQRIQREFESMMLVLAISPRAAIDEVLPWIKSVIHTEEDDIICLQFGAIKLESGPVHFLMR